MPSRVVRVRSTHDGVAAQSLREGIAAIQAEMHVSAEFPPEVEKAAAEAAANPRLPELDKTAIPFITIDPESAMDLDQALHIERDGDGYRVFYAIADLAAFITPGDPVDVEANRRGETLYGADSKIPLHPKVISEDAGSLLPDQVRPALLWTIDVDKTGEGTKVEVVRATVKSRAKLNYADVQKSIDDGSADEVFGLLKEVGELRLEREAARGGVSLPLPEQEIDIDGDQWRLEFRAQHPVEQWNAQISLLTGMAAASLMVYARVGLLRTLPPADPRDVKRLHRTAKALKIEWPAELEYPEFIRSLDPTKPNHAAMVVACTSLLRGSGYVGFNGELPAQPRHSAIASEYAHVTAPLRRLVDRYAGEICVALCADEEVPAWVIEKLTEVPETMRDSGRIANQYENAVLNLVEAAVLQPRVGESFDAVVVEIDDKDDHKGDITVQDPAIEASVTSSSGALPLGEQVSVKLESVDLKSRSIRFVTG
ncbi:MULTISPECIES: RNB domain-containing ribonuclease [unclassified Nocardioides]|uniref:RNB domain-containing ribonuclease n=1 Tax=unclassified Nocardioides TaxID=2615069 RepID=UPI0007017502|nr:MULTISPECIES: RNB domain-containing ribonuclease [unclassified Nocardioides]KQY51677.1 ribonuclease II [Nocardioides sp. Root140]KRF10912.1 ribonuclease II [Nocardioides sp. Soil796]